MSSQYTATVLEGKFKFNGGNRKIKATKTSLDGILSTARNVVTNSTDKVVSFVEKLKEKNVELTRLTEMGKCKATEGKAINVSSGMFKSEKENMEKIDNNQNLKEISLKMPEVAKEETNGDTNADSILNALNLFETTNNLETSTDVAENNEVPSFISQMTSEIDGKEEVQPEMEKSVEGEAVVVEPTHESSGYLNEINAFKSQIGTDKFADENTMDNSMKSIGEEPVRDFTVHTNSNPMRYNIPEPKFNENAVDSDIEDFVRGYSNLADLSLTQIKNYKFGCEQYIQNAMTKKGEASQAINGINMQIEEKDAQIKELYSKINAIEAEKGGLITDKKTWQGVYSAANTEESLGTTKMEEIDGFLRKEFDSINNGYSQKYDASENVSYGRGRAA